MTQDNTIDKVKIRREYYRSGALWWEIPYVNGVEHGIEKEYFETGALMWETPYANGWKHGIEKWYYESGALLREIPYVNGVKHGIEKLYEITTLNIVRIVRLTLYNKGQRVSSIKI